MLLSVRDLSKSFSSADGVHQVLNGVSFDVDGGETLALTGESGSGKSTLLHLIAGLDAPDGGTVNLAGREMTGGSDAARAHLRRKTIGLVFQQFNLIPSLTVAGNLAFQARLAECEDIDWTAALAARLGLEPFLDRYPEVLSGGQQQRVAIGRALAVRPALILADEPTGNLDESTSDSVMELMLELVGESGAALLLVTHSRRLAGRLERRLHLSGGRLR